MTGGLSFGWDNWGPRIPAASCPHAEAAVLSEVVVVSSSGGIEQCVHIAPPPWRTTRRRMPLSPAAKIVARCLIVAFGIAMENRYKDEGRRHTYL
ncbi:hypothetical protein E2562_035363 [Oryza meyeriana var. granulata]|uniref:Uncharacterized protein n=1 Tax=Oryza meyeriana var. granulata TaxID=110450 RepID=A0A6G1E942_9ORYZ|nr:hypothetical protein E2562_035363 [Oryza meyeriana var. granulata]